MKHPLLGRPGHGQGDAPSRGHDLKPRGEAHAAAELRDAPSRGHDLKLIDDRDDMTLYAGCPLTGA